MITLGHSALAVNAGLDIKTDFRKLVAVMRRRGLLKGYIKVIEFTKLGQPHIHMVYRGKFFMQVMISWLWSEVHLSPVVWINYIRRPQQGASYVAKYLGKDPACRYSMSHDWLWVGVAGDWKSLVCYSVKQGWEWEKLLGLWENILDSWRPMHYLYGSSPGVLVPWGSPCPSPVTNISSGTPGQLTLWGTPHIPMFGISPL
jgi:hypothetical protein